MEIKNNTSPVQTLDFIGFGESRSSKDFSPKSFSSPNKFYKKSPGSNQNPGRNWRYTNKNHNKSFSPNNNNISQKTWSPNYKNQSYNNRPHDKVNRKSYLHPSFMEDPWAQLEWLQKKKNSCFVENSNLSNTSTEQPRELPADVAESSVQL